MGETEHFEWVPGLGSFVEGYSLVLSKDHVFNTGCLDPLHIEELTQLVSRVKKVLCTLYGVTPIVFEHGSMGDRDYAGSCIEHHHLHILPVNLTHVPEALEKNFKDQRPIDSLAALAEFDQHRIPYIYFAPSSGGSHVFKVDIIPRQYLRQVVAAECGCPENWDWRCEAFTQNIKLFVSKIRALEGRHDGTDGHCESRRKN